MRLEFLVNGTGASNATAQITGYQPTAPVPGFGPEPNLQWWLQWAQCEVARLSLTQGHPRWQVKPRSTTQVFDSVLMRDF